ncbi:hypothetical protein WG66_005575 [Moniliophthora roreri]|nr:hypothetical protein WG66_005575 [Moniliophthora roreri]
MNKNPGVTEKMDRIDFRLADMAMTLMKFKTVHNPGIHSHFVYEAFTLLYSRMMDEDVKIGFPGANPDPPWKQLNHDLSEVPEPRSSVCIHLQSIALARMCYNCDDKRNSAIERSVSASTQRDLD